MAVVHQYLLTYRGNGTWQDQDKNLWGAKDEPTRNVKHSRAYQSDLDPEAFMESRPDFRFMIGYGAMIMDHAEVGEDGKQVITIEPENPQIPVDPPKEGVTETNPDTNPDGTQLESDPAQESTEGQVEPALTEQPKPRITLGGR